MFPTSTGIPTTARSMSTGTTLTTSTVISVPVPKSLHRKEHKAPFVLKFMNNNKNVKLVRGGLNGDDLYEQVISLDNLFLAWKEFRRGKSKKTDVRKFESNLGENILEIHRELRSKTYKHSKYFSFYVRDPKVRHIHKACVRDRVLHHAIFRVLYPIFDKSFIFDSYSCRLGKGTHRAVSRLPNFFRKASKNNSNNCFVLKCDIKKFFDSITHQILINLLQNRIKSDDTMWLLNKIIESFPVGLPLGNITSQLFANIYLGELDKFVKHNLKIKYYIRYCDDFVILSTNKSYLNSLVPKINKFLNNSLKLHLHPSKLLIRKYRQGIDFLGYVCFPYNTVLRPKTKKRMFRNIRLKMYDKNFEQILQSYLGILKHCNSRKLRLKLWAFLCNLNNTYYNTY